MYDMTAVRQATAVPLPTLTFYLQICTAFLLRNSSYDVIHQLLYINTPVYIDCYLYMCIRTAVQSVVCCCRLHIYWTPVYTSLELSSTAVLVLYV